MKTDHIKKILNGHRSFDTAYKVEDYPYGFRLRTTIYYWIETTKKRGDRLCTCTIDPRNGRLNKPKKSTYSPFLFLYLDEKGHVQADSISAYETDKFPAKINFLINTIEEATDEQVENLRAEYYMHMRANYPYILPKYNDERKPLYTEWMKGLLTHIATTEIDQWSNYRPAPEQDQPDEQIKMIIKEYNTEHNG